MSIIKLTDEIYDPGSPYHVATKLNLIPVRANVEMDQRVLRAKLPCPKSEVYISSDYFTVHFQHH